MQVGRGALHFKGGVLGRENSDPRQKQLGLSFVQRWKVMGAPRKPFQRKIFTGVQLEEALKQTRGPSVAEKYYFEDESSL
ncbi:hypothetical protein MUG91_G53n97 [Manis pentadactyla]|nr:hypothetical protein MUG91_G53n97 [Manis pentadactyla]